MSEQTGRCPECGTRVRLDARGRITTHRDPLVADAVNAGACGGVGKRPSRRPW